jgi:hypothetical protein
MLIALLTQHYLRDTYLRGIDLGAAWQGPSADAAIDSILHALIEDAQGKLGIQFKRQRVLTYPDHGLVLGVDYDIQAEPLTYFKAPPGAQHFIIPLPFANVQSIERVRLFYGNPLTNPQGRSLYQVPQDWILFTGKEGILRINPSITNAVLQTQNIAGATGGFESIYYGYFNRIEIPGAWAIDMVIGNGQIPLDVAEWICLGAAIDVLAKAGAGTDVSHGLSSESLSQDGMTENIAHYQGKYGPYTGVIQHFMDRRKDINIWGKRLKYKGVKVAAW